jgi:CheY-like chemotaxis protein
MNGLEFIKKVKELEAFSNIPIIAVMSGGQEREWQEAIKLVDGVLIKPFTSTELHTAVASHISPTVFEPVAKV